MRPATRLLKHVPLIKFVGGPHKPAHVSSTPQVHPCAPEGLLPSSGSSSSSYKNDSSIDAPEGQVFSRSQLPKRFQYSFPKEDEMENIITGGAAIVF